MKLPHPIAAALGSATLIVMSLSGAGAAGASAATDAYYGCPAGAVCIYAQDPGKEPTADPDPHRITNIYYSYGAHNLSNQYGYHWVANNQTGGSNATYDLCRGYNGVNCTFGGIPRTAWHDDLTPINSIVLNRP
ncbi:hypothetical protein ABZ915_43730 [Streptomyces sp. NPDC046915]|uniref:hypothetical protein n=1 Tax=Streptomyces sp. NPDC046915 TaxID=3155257 RepID=UPI0033DA554F